MAEEQKDSSCTTGQFSLTTPLGSITSRGKKTAELIATLSLAALLILGYVLWGHTQDSVQDRHERIKYVEMLAIGLNNMAKAQREMACIISLPPERREAEYKTPDSFCKRIGVMP